jgi:transposase-like protein
MRFDHTWPFVATANRLGYFCADLDWSRMSAVPVKLREMTAAGKRRWTSAEKLRMVEECLAPEAIVADVARRHDIHPNQLHAWRRQARLGLLTSWPVVAAQDGCRFAPVAVAALQQLVAAFN